MNGLNNEHLNSFLTSPNGLQYTTPCISPGSQPNVPRILSSAPTGTLPYSTPSTNPCTNTFINPYTTLSSPPRTPPSRLPCLSQSISAYTLPSTPPSRLSCLSQPTSAYTLPSTPPSGLSCSPQSTSAYNLPSTPPSGPANILPSTPPLTPSLSSNQLNFADTDIVEPSVNQVEDLRDFSGSFLYFDEILKEPTSIDEYIDIILNGFDFKGENVPYSYFIKKLNSLGKYFYYKRKKGAKRIRISQMNSDEYKDFYVHPIFLILKSFKFFKFFKQIYYMKKKSLVEFEVPSLSTFEFVLYYLYTGITTKINDFAKNDESIYNGILKNLSHLDLFISA